MSGRRWILAGGGLLVAVLAALTVAPRPAQAQSTFEPDITVIVGGLDRNGDGAHDFAGATLQITFDGRSASCPDVQQNYELQANGMATPTAVAALRAYEFGGTVGPVCEYQVDAPPHFHSRRLLEVRSGSDPTITRNPNARSATINYETASTSFTIHVDVTLIEATSNTAFRPQFDASPGSPEGCDGRRTPHTGWSNAVSQPEEFLTGRFYATIEFPRGHDENTPECTYDVTWPPDEDGPGTSMTRDLTAPATAQVSANSPRAHATYTLGSTTTLEPSLTFNVPMIDVDGDDIHDFSGTRFEVMFARSSDTNCSADRTISYRLNDDGEAMPRLNPVYRPLRLVNQHKDSSAPCEYAVTFPPGSSDTFVDRLEKLTVDASDDDDLTGTANDAEAIYQAAGVPFDATFSLTTTNVPDGIELQVTVTPRSAMGCSPADTHTLAVASDAASAMITLIDWPVGYTTASDRCVYDLEWSTEVAHAGVLYGRDEAAPPSATVDGANAATSAAYQRVASTFTPTPTFTVPQIDLDGDSTHDFSGTEFEVTFTRSADANCSMTRTETYRLSDAGAVAAVEPLVLVDEHEDSAAPCTYTVEFAPTTTAASAGKLAKHADPTTDDGDVSAAANDAAATYRTTEVRFDATLSVAVARVPDGAAFGVSVAPQSTSGCSAADTHMLTVASGAVSVTVSLIDLPVGYTALSDRCVYDVTWDDDEQGASAEYPRDPSVAATTTIDGANAARSATYWGAATSFAPSVTIAVPDYDRDGAPGTNYFEATTFGVTFTKKAGEGPATDCSPTTQVTYVVGDANTAVARSFTPTGGQQTTISPTSPLLLTDLPAGQGTSCVYVARFDDDVSSAPGATPAWTLTRLASQAATADVRSGVTVEREYAASTISFAPTVAVTVPPVAGLGPAGQAGENLFAGTMLDVTLRRATGAHGECSAMAPVTAAYTVEPGGAVSPPTSDALPAMLVDRPAGQTARCEYEFSFTSTAASAPAAALTWTLTLPSASASLTAALPNLTAAYVVGNVMFSPHVAISVPTYAGDDDPATDDVDESKRSAFAGRTFEVEFVRAAGPMSGCSSGATPNSAFDATYVVGAGGTVGPAGGVEPSLVHLPSGETTAVCVYDVTFPLSVGADPPLGREAAGLDAQTQASEPDAAASYLASAETTFSPSVAVSLPFIDSDDDGANDLASLDDAAVIVTIEYRRVTSVGTFAGCTETATENYTVAPEAAPSDPTGDAADDGSASQGTVSGPDTPAVLTDRPARADDRCVYAALVSETDALRDELPARAVEPSSVQPPNVAVTISYGAMPPVVTPPVPPPSVARPSGGSPPRTSGRSGGGTGGGSGGSTSRTPSADRDDTPDDWMTSSADRLPVTVSLTQPDRAVAPSDAVEVLISAPDTCGIDIAAFDGLPASVGVVFALAARSNATSQLVADGALTWPHVAERGTQQRPCVVRVTLLAAPAGCTFAGSAGGSASEPSTDDAGRAYVELTWSEGATSFTLAPALTCE